jgi:hypothetical protein
MSRDTKRFGEAQFPSGTANAAIRHSPSGELVVFTGFVRFALIHEKKCQMTVFAVAKVMKGLGRADDAPAVPLFLARINCCEVVKSLSETHSISANVEFPWLAGRFPPARHSGAAKICFIPGQIMLYFTYFVTGPISLPLRPNILAAAN